MSNPLADMELPDVIFCIGTNMTECHPVAATRLKKAVANGAKMYVADPRKIGLVRYAEGHLQLKVGTDVALLLGMASVILEEDLINHAFVDSRTEGVAKLRAHVADKDAAWAAEITGVPEELIREAARAYAKAERGAIYYTLGITEHITGVDNVRTLCNLPLLTGHIGRPGTGINPMRGQNNVQGSGDCGAIPNFYPGFQPVTDPEQQKAFAEVYGREVSLEKGITKVTAFDRCGDGIHAMLIDGENTAASDPDLDHCRKALGALDHLVVIDIFLTETAEMADVVLPATAWGETDGSCSNTERRIQRLRQAVSPPGEAKPDWWIISQIAQRMGIGGFEFRDARDVFNELCEVSRFYRGVNWEMIDKGEYHWPVFEKGHPGTPILHVDEFENGRGLFATPEHRDPAETTDEQFPLWLTTGRRLATYHTNTQTGRAAGLESLVAHETLEVHPDDVIRLGLVDGGRARLESVRGSVDILVEATTKSPPGTVFTSFAFRDVPVNELTGGGYDPVTQTAELKVCPVRVTPIDRAPRPTEV